MSHQMLDDRLLIYERDGVNNSCAAIRVPEGMTVGDFFPKMGDSLKDFVKAIQEGKEAASKGDLRQVDKHLETLTRLNEDYTSRGGALRGIKEYNRYVMSLAIENHLGNPVTDDVKEYARKYDVHLEIVPSFL